MSPLDTITSGGTTGLAGVVDRLSRRLGGGDRQRDGVTRRGVLAGAAVAGSAMVVDPKGFALTPQTAYATICGPGNKAWNGWTVFCCTVNKGRNSCPPGSFAAGWWKAARSSWCGGGYQYIVDCNAKCTGCTSGCSGDHICSSSCWNCSCGSGSSATCDQRRHCCNAFRYGQCNTQISCSGGVNCRVLSCVPPYKWASCTTTSLVDNRTAEHGAPCLEGWSAIAAKYNGMGGHGSWLKASAGPERSVGDGRGRYVAYQGGWIYATSATGAHTINPTVKKLWDAVGGPKGTMGYPRTDPVSMGGGWVQVFQRGAVADGPKTGACTVRTQLFDCWSFLGRAQGVLGWPKGEERAIRGGRQQDFTGGIALNATGSKYGFAVRGKVLTAYLAAGGATGRYGFPLENPRTASGGRLTQKFQHGTITA